RRHFETHSAHPLFMSLSPSATAPPQDQKPIPPRSRLGSRLILLLATAVVSLGLTELVLRLAFHKKLAPTLEERILPYRSDAQLGWFPAPNTTKQVSGCRTITATHNSRGFRDVEPPQNKKPGIIFLGDSLVWGFDVEASERFTEKLQARHKNWNIYNFGISGYGTDQEFLLLQRYFDLYRPRAVVLVICGDNDNEDNAWNVRGGYYK